MNKVRVWSILCGGCALFSSFSAVAEEGGKASLPQLDASLYLGQLFWLALFFPTLYALIRWVAYPRMEKSLGNRRDLLKADLEAAASANEEAKKIQAECDASLADARAKAHATVNEIILKASKEASEQQSSQRLAIERRMLEAEGKIEAQKHAALREVKASAGAVAVAIVEKLTGHKSA